MSFLQKKIFNFSPDAFGLDMSDLSLKAVMLEAEGKQDRVASYGTVPLPPGAILDGEIIKAEIVAEAIRALLEKAGPVRIKTRRVICSLPETKAFLRIIHLPMMSPEEAREAVKWEIEANIPLTLDQVYYDFQLLERSLSKEPHKMSALVVAVARATTDQFLAVLEAAGLEVVGLETESIAQARSLLLEAEKDKTTMIVDIGDRRTSFLVTIGSIPVFTSSIPLSSQMVTDAIAKGMRVSFEEAEQIKLTSGIGSPVKHDALFRIVEPVLENFVVEIERSLDFYVNGMHYSERVDSLVICGGGANAQGLLPYLSRRLRKPIEFGNPWVNMRLGKDLPIIEREHSVQYSTALGLALRSLKHYESHA